MANSQVTKHAWGVALGLASVVVSLFFWVPLLRIWLGIDRNPLESWVAFVSLPASCVLSIFAGRLGSRRWLWTVVSPLCGGLFIAIVFTFGLR